MAIGAGVAFRVAAARASAGRVALRGRNYETNIKKKKGPADIKRGKTVDKHLRKIIICVKEGGANEETNPALERMIKMALKDNVPRSTIDQRIKKFTSGSASDEIILGGYGFGGTAVMVQCMTDNSKRCRMEVRQAFKEVGGQIGAEGCVDHLFTKEGLLSFQDTSEEAVVEASMEGDAEVEDVVTQEDGSVVVKCLPENFHAVLRVLDTQGLEPAEADVVFSPVMVEQPNEEAAYELTRLVELLEELEDVQGVHHNSELPSDIELKYNTYGIALPFKRT